jgi:hypothetical protein
MNNELSETSRANLASQVSTIVRDTPVFDIHTHLYDPAFGSLLLYGIDDLLTYHYLVAEVFRYTDVPYETFWKLTKIEQADLVWDHLFIQHSPISEACRGVLTTLNKLGLDVRKRDLPLIRKWYSEQTPHSFVDRCLELANVNKICMTNSPFDPIERPVWEKGFSRDERFVGGLRIDPLLLEWPNAMAQLQDDGHSVQAELNDSTISGIRHFLSKWSQTYQAQYLMVSLPPSFQYPSEEPISTILDQAVIPHCIENNQPLALMIGVKRAVNPQLSLAGDGMGRADLEALENLCRQHPEANFLCTVLAKENQHELCVLARKFPNLHIFGCWWFTNVPHVIDEMTRLRFELVGLSLTPQHSDARVLDQLIYKWSHSRELIAKILTEKYDDLSRTGWEVSKQEIQRDVSSLFGGAFESFCSR